MSVGPGTGSLGQGARQPDLCAGCRAGRSFDQKCQFLQPGYVFESLEIVFFRALLVGTEPRGTEEVSEFDLCLCVDQFQSCHLNGELSVVGFVLLKLSLDEGDFFEGHVCVCLSVVRQVLSLTLSIAIVRGETCTLQSCVRLVASATNPI